MGRTGEYGCVYEDWRDGVQASAVRALPFREVCGEDEGRLDSSVYHGYLAFYGLFHDTHGDFLSLRHGVFIC